MNYRLINERTFEERNCPAQTKEDALAYFNREREKKLEFCEPEDSTIYVMEYQEINTQGFAVPAGSFFLR